jgi:hypothetical protein
MYFDSLGHMGKALHQAQGAFRIEHSVAIMCLAVTNVSVDFRGFVVELALTDYRVDLDPNVRL